MTESKKNVCDACRKPIRDGEGARIINDFMLHKDDNCFFLYTEKVKNGILRVAYNTERNT